MKVHIEEVPSFTIIGRLGSGKSDSAIEWIQPLWRDLEANFAEVSHMIDVNENGSPLEVWGVMSDMDETFRPWDPEKGGKYLAGFTAKDDGAQPPPGWTKWRVPGFRYAVARTSAADYARTMKHMLDAHMPENGFVLAGAIHEKYPTPANPSIIDLYFPVKRLG